MIEMRIDPTEQLRVLNFQLREMQTNCDNLRAAVDSKQDRIQELRWIIRGIIQEQYHLHVHINAPYLDDGTHNLAMVLMENYVGQTIHELERKMGTPLQRLSDALMHIDYLEAHAMNSGLHFDAFKRKESDAWLMR